ncbi:hypothetical protein LD125_00470 [Mesoplasma sp. JKS002658]|uniref:restriction endonuclease subunit S n=1 Tax=Mesoplasma whartonense TaxID=2878854 RepID=UPI002022A1C8|nr:MULTISPECIES: restriction endonuclease subunit S [unclassified Mesoplasma]MCL8212264.1 hypothetical protein [Mesoplasma sp. JKS002662]MCL8214207.1 hypothetical protein [Mesoplasma sp. JKS002658]
MAIIGIQTGNSNTEDAQEKGIYPLFDRSQVIKRSNKYLFDGEYVIVAGEGNFKPKYYNGKFDLHQRAYCIKSTDTTKLSNKYLYYLILKNYQIFNNYSVGSTVPSLRLSSFNWINKISFPAFEEQQKIIDIIAPKEELFLKFSNTIRVDNFEHTKNDLKNLIDIIEPIEKLIDSINFAKKKTISLISKMGELSLLASKNIESIKFDKQKEKYIESGNYVSTGNIGDFNNLIEKFEQLSSNPTRARLKFKKDTLYISKLDGEKKILYLNKDRDLVLSNGMWGIEGNEDSKYSLYAFLLSNTFYEEKTLKSTGTTMRGLNDNTLKQIINYYSITKKHNWLVKKYFVYLSFLTELLEVFYKIKNKFIKFFVV